MASVTRGLTEPYVLAHTKRRLFPEEERDNTYSVVDTQFAVDHWISEEAISEEIKEVLAPFNHVRIGSGYPDLVGVRNLESDLLAVERFGDDPPLVVVEAKGYTRDGFVDIERGIVQAYDRLHEANVAYVAAPRRAISHSHRTLARELNVGMLSVSVDGTVDSIVVPRVVGNRTTGEGMSIRFQASTQGVANKSFGLNHPKNYLAYPLALYHPDDTASLLSEYVVGAVDSARTGATFLDLIDTEPNHERLTPLGKEVVRFAHRKYGNVDTALATFEGWKRSRQRFCDLAPKWGQLTRRIVYEYPASQLLVTELQNLHDDGVTDPTLPEFVRYLHELHPSFTVELFFRGDEDVRKRVLTQDGDLREDDLENGSVYHSPTVFQLKTMLYHAGILTDRGVEPSNLDPNEDVWALRERL